MPVKCRIDTSKRCVFSVANGVVTDADLLAHQELLKTNADFQSSLNQIAYFRELERIEVSAEAIRTLAKNNPFGLGARRAFIVDSPLGYGLARMFQAYAIDSGDEIEVFWDSAAAEEWLGLTPESLP